jgi:hypothetical protein
VNNTVLAVEQVRRMRGGSQSHLMRCDDGNYYVVKFPDNPQGTRILANEFLATALIQSLGLPGSAGRIVRVTDGLIAHSEEMYFELKRGRAPLKSGLCFGSLYQQSESWQGGPAVLNAYDFLPVSMLQRVENIADFAGMLVFDQWTNNLDDRQVVFVMRNGLHSARMIDHGWCFGVTWDFDTPTRGLYFPPSVYENIRDFESFEPWLTRLDQLSLVELREIARMIPSEWYERDEKALAALIAGLHKRREKVREELRKTQRRFPQFFPNWKPCTMAAVP